MRNSCVNERKLEQIALAEISLSHITYVYTMCTIFCTVERFFFWNWWPHFIQPIWPLSVVDCFKVFCKVKFGCRIRAKSHNFKLTEQMDFIQQVHIFIDFDGKADLVSFDLAPSSTSVYNQFISSKYSIYFRYLSFCSALFFHAIAILWPSGSNKILSHRSLSLSPWNSYGTFHIFIVRSRFWMCIDRVMQQQQQQHQQQK